MKEIDYRRDFIRPRAITWYYDTHINDALKEKNITWSSGHYLMHINFKPGCSMKELSEDMDVDRAMTTRTVKMLIEKDLVENRGTKKTYSLYLTKDGESLVQSVRQSIENANRKLFEDFTDEEKEIAIELLSRVREKIKETKRERNECHHNCG